MVGGAIADSTATPEPDVKLSLNPALQYPVSYKNLIPSISRLKIG